MKRIIKISMIICVMFVSLTSSIAQVKYDEGRIQIDGIQFLQDSNDDDAYYYLTRFVRLATKDDGTYEFLCIKYIGEDEKESGGIFHALVEFSLPNDLITNLEVKLKERVGENARIVGPVPLRQFDQEGESGIGKFDVVSSILTNTDGEEAFTRNVLASGFSPLGKGSKSAIAAKLTPSGTTLLWNSLSGPTSDVSVSVHGYYEAKVKGYNAIVKADASTIYEHYSKTSNKQGGYTKSELRKMSNEMVQDQILEIEVFDRAEGLGVETKEMQAILDIVTDKLIELMFDTQTGWAAKPAEEVAVEAGQIKGRQERGWFDSVFGGTDNTEYYSDNQYVVKRREDIRTNSFYLNLTKSTTIKVPIHTSGNIGGLYDAMKDDERYFRVINLDDVDYQKRAIHFQVDSGFSDAFNEILNSVSVAFRKVYGEGTADETSDIIFTHQDLKEGKDFKTVYYPRLGLETSDWLDYEYKLSWNMKGIAESITVPKNENQWAKSDATLIALVPPFNKRMIEIDADRSEFKENNIRSASVRFLTVLNGEPIVQRTAILREGDTEATSKVNLYHDDTEPVAYQVTWYSATGKYSEPMTELNQDYLFLMIPSSEKFEN